MNKDDRNIEAIYPLAPMQEGMLFHTLYAPEARVYFQQRILTLDGNLNVRAFERAWQRVVERHPVFRTLFVWEHQKKWLQVVRKSIDLPWVNWDWRHLSLVEQQEQLASFVQADREQGFSLDQAPLMRCALIKLQKNTHYLVWSFHHLLIDGWSVPIILKEVLAFYAAFNQGQPLSLNPPRPYRDYIAWLQQQDLSSAEAFWRQTLKDFRAPTPLVVDTSNSLSNQKTHKEQYLRLSVQASAALQSLARQHHLTLNTLFLGAWSLLLSRYSGESDVVFGATVSGRPAALLGVESMVGLFINTLPVRVQVSGKVSLLPWLQQIQAQLVELRLYEYTPLYKLQQWSDVPSGMPLFESLVVFENYPRDSSLRQGDDGLQIGNLQSSERTDYPLTVVASPGQELSVEIIYDSCRFETATIERMAGHLQTLLEGIVANPEQKVSELPLLTISEQQQLLVEWNHTQEEYFQDKCIHQLVEAQVEQAPEAIAVVFENQQLTYRELNARSNQLAHHLQKLGVGPEVLVGICVERSIEMVVGLLGILKAGGAYVPLDPAYPKERLAFMLEDSQVSTLLTQEKLLAGLPECTAQVICLDSNWQLISQASDKIPFSCVTPENLAYAIYTSGSTGRPKGVLIAHQGLCNLAAAQIRSFGVQPSSRVVQFASLSFDASIWEIVMALCAGARLCLGTPDSLLPGLALMQLLQEQGITHATLPPSALAAMPLGKLPALQTIILAGEACSPDLVAQWSKGRNLFNAYGPTESTVCATVAQCTDARQKLPIGRPIAGLQVYILDPNLQPVPIGVPGELHIGGAGLARGYLNHPHLTQEKFIPNPFRKDGGRRNEFAERLYKTGDLVRYLSDGNIEFLARLDHQAKIRGFRIELGEVEVALSQHPEIQETVVIAREDTPSDKRLVAYIVPKQEALNTNTLRSFLKKKLPDYMVPSAFVLLDTLPLTPNGKVDRRALPAPDTSRLSLETSFIPPRTPVEEKLALIWAEVLSPNQAVGIHDNFFELGGHSLLATQIISRIRQVFDVDLPLRSLFAAPTVAELGDRIATIHWAAQRMRTPGSDTGDHEEGKL